MKKLVFALATGLLLLGCQKDDGLTSASRNVVSENSSIAFEDLLMLISLKTAGGDYLVVESVDSINVFINNGHWAKISSSPFDTTNVDKFALGNRTLTDDKLNYLVLADQDIREPDFTEAGEYAQFLNASYDLDAGEYVCFIESFQVTFNDNTTQTYYPLLYQTFKVETNTRSAFVGEIELNID